MQPKSPALLILFSLPLTFLMAGCTPPAPTELEPPRQFAGKKVRVACPAGAPSAVVQAYSRAWADRERATVQVASYEPATGPERLGVVDVLVTRPAALSMRAA